MKTFVIGDVHGCLYALQTLLEKIKYSDTDAIWFTGDLVNRGQQSLATVRFVQSLKKSVVVLGNHDIALLIIAKYPHFFKEGTHTFTDVLQAEDREVLLDWLARQPLLHYDAALNTILVHAGIYPGWDLQQAQSLAQEGALFLRDRTNPGYADLYGNTPIAWNDDLQGLERIRFIVNSFTRMRFCNDNGELDFSSKEGINKAPQGFVPWFKIADRNIQDERIIFGHWAALEGKTGEKNTIALDTGCVWGNKLSALCLEEEQFFSISCSE